MHKKGFEYFCISQNFSNLEVTKRINTKPQSHEQIY